jgi:hypothetical protein
MLKKIGLLVVACAFGASAMAGPPPPYHPSGIGGGVNIHIGK